MRHFECIAFEPDSCDSKSESSNEEYWNIKRLQHLSVANVHPYLVFLRKVWILHMNLSNINLKVSLCLLGRKEDPNLIQRMSSLSFSRNWLYHIPGWLGQPRGMRCNYLYLWCAWFYPCMKLLCLHRKTSSYWAIWARSFQDWLSLPLNMLTPGHGNCHTGSAL